MTRTTNQIIEDMQTLLDELRGQTVGAKAGISAPTKKKLSSLVSDLLPRRGAYTTISVLDSVKRLIRKAASS